MNAAVMDSPTWNLIDRIRKTIPAQEEKFDPGRVGFGLPPKGVLD
jgi:hypothetical protein